MLRAELRGVINAGTADYLREAVLEAERAQHQALLVVLDTPGGELGAMRAIVQAFLRSSVPVVVYVAPSGARAGSAGMFVTMAAHVAAMTPATTIGAAHPVLGTGQDPERAGEQLARKVVSDVSALARGIANERGRNAEWAESAVRESRSATAEEALALGVIDRLAPSERALLEALDGTHVEIAGRALELRTGGVSPTPFEMTLQQRALSVLGDPNVAYVLLMIGLLGLFLELSSPGLMVPGTVGVLALLLGAIGMNLLPLHLGAVALIVAGVGLIAAELFVTSYGLLLVGGLSALVVGSLLLVDPRDLDYFADPALRVSPGAVLPAAIAVGGAALIMALRARRSGRSRSSTGREGLVGEPAETLTEVGPSGGRVRVSGESWAARAEAPIPPGRGVRVRAVRGLELWVQDMQQEPGGVTS